MLLQTFPERGEKDNSKACRECSGKHRKIKDTQGEGEER